MPSKRLFTGQTFDDSVLLYDYGARWYDPYLARFVSPDTIVPDFTDPQSLNRYSYVLNNPLRYTDKSGHLGPVLVLIGVVVLATAVMDAYDIGSSVHTIYLDSSATPYEKRVAANNLGVYVTMAQMDGPYPVGDLLAGGRGAVRAFHRLAGRGARAEAMEMLAAEKGITGSMGRLTSALRSGKKGAEFQAERTLYYAQELEGVEVQEAFGDTHGYLDIKLTGGRIVDAKDWSGWSRHSAEEHLWMLDHLEDQAHKYLSNASYKLKFEFRGGIPDDVLAKLESLQALYGDRLTWEGGL